MKIGLSRVNRKLSKLFGVPSDAEYILDEDGKVIAKRMEKQCIQLFVETADGVKILVLAKGLKRKLGQDLNVTSVATLFEFDGERLVEFVKSRAFTLKADMMLEQHQISMLGTANEDENKLHVVIEPLGIDEVLEERDILPDGQVIYIINEKTKTLKNEPKK